MELKMVIYKACNISGSLKKDDSTYNQHYHCNACSYNSIRCFYQKSFIGKCHIFAETSLKNIEEYCTYPRSMERKGFGPSVTGRTRTFFKVLLITDNYASTVKQTSHKTDTSLRRTLFNVPTNDFY